MKQKKIDKKLNYCETVQLIKKAIQAEVLANEPDNDKNVLLYVNVEGEEKLCSVPILDAGYELMELPEMQKMLKEEIANKGFDATHFNEYTFEPPSLKDIEEFEKNFDCDFDYEEDEENKEDESLEL